MSLRMKTWMTLAVLTLPLAAQEGDSRIKFSGFGTVGLVSNQTDLAEYVREPNQPRGALRSPNGSVDSRLGLQVNLNLGEDLSFVGQVISKYRWDHTFNPDISWAFLSYKPSSSIQLRAGRLGFDVFQIADTRNVGYSYLWARPPVDFFGPLMLSSLDGGDLTWSHPLAEGLNLRLKIAAGQTAPIDKVPFGDQGKYVPLGGSKLFGTVAELDWQDLNLRVSYAEAKPSENFPPPITDLQDGLYAYASLLNDPGLARQAKAMGFQENCFRYLSFGANWQTGPLRVEAVGAQVRAGDGPIPDLKSAYLSVGYRQGAYVPYFLASRIVSDPHTVYLGALPVLGPQAAALADGVSSFIQHQRANQTTLACGLRWDFLPRTALKVQVDRIMGNPNDIMLWLNVKPGWEGKATVGSVSLDFVF